MKKDPKKELKSDRIAFRTTKSFRKETIRKAKSSGFLTESAYITWLILNDTYKPLEITPFGIGE